MRLNYYVLCIDDEIDSLGEYKSVIESVNNEVGIKTIFRDISAKPRARETDETKLLNRLKININDAFSEGPFELILVDLHLGTLSGHQMIEFIRNTHTMFRPIVFYSGGQPKNEEKATEQLHEALEKNNLVGKCIFLSSRDRLPNDLRKICGEMHIEEQKLKASRGLLMDRTSEVDALVLSHLRKSDTWDKLSESQSEEFIKSARKRLTKKAKSTAKSLDFFQALAEEDIEVLKSYFVDPKKQKELREMDSSIRNSLFKALLCVQPDQKASGEKHIGYFNNNEGTGELSISAYRNKYAHQTEAELSDEHDAKLCKYLRIEIRKHLENVRAIVTTE